MLKLAKDEPQRPSASKAMSSAQGPSPSKSEAPQALGPSKSADAAFDKAFDLAEKIVPEQQAIHSASSAQPAAPGTPNGEYSASWVVPHKVEEVVRAWAQEIQASAPPRHHLDFAVHMEANLGLLIERLRGK